MKKVQYSIRDLTERLANKQLIFMMKEILDRLNEITDWINEHEKSDMDLPSDMPLPSDSAEEKYEPIDVKEFGDGEKEK